MRTPIFLGGGAFVLIGAGVLILATAPVRRETPPRRPPTSPLLEIRISEKSVTMSGLLPPGRPKESLVRDVRALFPGTIVNDFASADSTVLPAPWMNQWHTLLSTVRDTRSTVFLQVKEDTLRLYGTVPERRQRTAILRTAQRAMSSHLIVIDMLTAGEPPPAE